jgi:hypothetical protein
VTDEMAILPATPRGLVMRTESIDGAPVLRVWRRWRPLALGLVVAMAGAVSAMPLAGAIACMAVPVAFLRNGTLDRFRLAIGRGGISAGQTLIPFDTIERCELEGGRVFLALHDGRKLQLFAGNRAQAAWIARTIDAARATDGAPMPLPTARLLTSG